MQTPAGETSYWVHDLDPTLIAIVVISLFAVGLVAGVLPAIRAARIAPADALRGH